MGSTKHPPERFAAVQDFAALLADASQPVHHVVDRAAVDQRAHQRVLGRADRRCCTCPYARDQRLGDLRRDAALQEQAARGGAALAGGADGAEQDGAQHQVGVGVVHHDDAVVAAEFEDRAAQPAARPPRRRGGPLRSTR